MLRGHWPAIAIDGLLTNSEVRVVYAMVLLAMRWLRRWEEAKIQRTRRHIIRIGNVGELLCIFQVAAFELRSSNLARYDGLTTLGCF